MYVICDIEWVTNLKCKPFPTQIAAIKVNKKWNIISSFSSLICPPMERKYTKNNVAFTGGDYSDFYSAKSAQEVFKSFYQWLDEDDILLWWFDNSDKMFRNFSTVYAQSREQNESIILCDYILSYLKEELGLVNQYTLADRFQIDITCFEKHYAIHDAIVICYVLRELKYPQELFQFSSRLNGVLPYPIERYSNFQYYYDPQTNLIHDNKCCELIDASIKTIGYPNFEKAIRKGYKPCDCCKDMYKQAIKDRNIENIRINGFNFVFSPTSNIYHKSDCPLVLTSRCIKGTHTLEAVLKNERHPCKICKPPYKVEDFNYREIKKDKSYTQRFKSKQVLTNKEVKPKVTTLRRTPLRFVANKEEMRAVNRHKVAAKERAVRLHNGLSCDEIDNIYVLTQPRFAFFASKGHKHFHLKTCPIVENLSHLRGFETYSDAIKAKFVPCRHCKPTSKHDLKLSVPIYNKLRENESVSDLESMCCSCGYECEIDNNMVHIITPVGKWIVHSDSIPIKMEHINLSRNPNEKIYHKQPRLFLSFTDVFLYIKQHDNNLIETHKETIM